MVTITFLESFAQLKEISKESKRFSQSDKVEKKEQKKFIGLKKEDEVEFDIDSISSQTKI